jgi:hypothetical protein
MDITLSKGAVIENLREQIPMTVRDIAHFVGVSNYIVSKLLEVVGIALATGWMVRESNPGEGRHFPYPFRQALGPTQSPT